MLVNNRLSTWARTWAGVGAAECAAVAASVYFRPSPVIGFLPGNDPIWTVVFFAIGAGFLAIAAAVRASRRYGMFCFAVAATAHAMYGVGALGYSITEHMSWVLASCMFALSALNGLAAFKIAGPKH